ncbi:DUF1223 domain-containing protein [Hyphococcus sp.]|uniref:DUF1223 domain-containing protein n=1 Tax=Hyphococcus sp. TaxID=2038636 RepID=UPI003CCC02C7
MKLSCFRLVILAGAGLPLLHGASLAQNAARAQAGSSSPAETPVLVEMFLSQACSSCTAAAKLMPGLAAREDVVALSWHVDYWNRLNTKQGQWADPYSQAAYTVRQKTYNMHIRNRSSVYTPQVIIDGGWETVGSSKAKIETLIDAASKRDGRTAIKTSVEGNAFLFDVGESDNGGNAMLVTFKKRVSTDIPRGENAGKTFDNAHVVTGVRPLGVVLKRGDVFTAERPAAGDGCALIIQEPTQARIIAAAYCPS